MNTTGSTPIAKAETPAPAGLLRGQDGRLRCRWAGHDPLYQHYHDTEWGRPSGDDGKIFEMLCLEALQAGLSWITILRKRENFRAALHGFDFYRLAGCNAQAAVERLMLDRGLIRHRGKLAALFTNAGAAVKLVAECGSFTAWLRAFQPPAAEHSLSKAESGQRTEQDDSPAAESNRQAHISARAAGQSCAARLARDLKKRGFRFIGPTSAYAFMQAAGMVNDHSPGCCCFAAAAAAQKAFYAGDSG